MLFENWTFLNRTTFEKCKHGFIVMIFSLFMSACNTTVDSSAVSNSEKELYEKPPVKIANNVVTEQQSGEFYHALVAEMYQQQDQSLLAVEHYLQAAKYTKNQSLLETTTTLAARAGQTKKALENAKRWVKVDANSLQARQFLALLLLRSDQFTESANALYEIQRLVAKDAEEAITPHQFLYQMLSLESHSLQAFKTYQVYLGSHRDQHVNSKNNKKEDVAIYNFQQMMLAKLAIKAKQYKTVLTALKDEKSADGLLLKAKSLHQLGKTSQSVTMLRPIINNQKTSDVTRFEFVRFLILANQKNEARLVLKKLVDKHPDNKDLLKSLVALDLDQKKWDEAEYFANKLLAFKDYRSDARHFLGEVFEGRGANQKALLSYLQVVDGKMVLNAQQKIPELLKKEQGLAAARLWLHTQRSDRQSSVVKTKEAVTKLSDKRKASLYKLEADLLFTAQTFDTALEFYQRAVVLDPNNTEIRYSRGLVYEKQGKLKLAEKDFLYALKIDKNNKADYVAKLKHLKSPEVASHLIDVLQKQGQQHQANSLLMQIRRLFPNDKSLNKL